MVSENSSRSEAGNSWSQFSVTATRSAENYYLGVDILFPSNRLPLTEALSMKLKLCALLLGISTLVGCSHTARLYPVQGALSAQTPLPVLVAKITTGALKPKDISVVLSDGEVCKGHWVIVPQAQISKGANTESAPPMNGMSLVWDTFMGQGSMCRTFWGQRPMPRLWLPATEERS